MTFRWFMLVMSLASASAWIAWFFVLHSIDPVKTSLLGFVLFYATIFIACLGTTVMLGTLIRLWLHPEEILYRQTVRSFRQGIIFSLLFTSTLLLLAFDLLFWWTIALLIILFTLVELYFVSKRT